MYYSTNSQGIKTKKWLLVTYNLETCGSFWTASEKP